MTTLDDIRLLLKRFFDGETTVEEEHILYAFYDSHASLPADMEQYRPLITDLGEMDFGDMNLDETDIDDAAFDEADLPETDSFPIDTPVVTSTILHTGTETNVRTSFRHKLLVTLSGIAASLLVCVTVYSFLHRQHEQQQFAAIYEGSYVIQNGKRIDDLSLIKTDIEHAIGQAESIETHVQEQNSAIDAAEEDILKHASPEQRAQLEEMMK